MGTEKFTYILLIKKIYIIANNPNEEMERRSVEFSLILTTKGRRGEVVDIGVS